MFNTPGLEAVCVEPDVPYLNEVAQKCVDAGMHIHMDKPGGEDLRGFAKLLSDAKRKGLLVQMAYMYRYNPAIQHCVEAAVSGALGEIFEIDAQMSTRHDAAYRQWLSQYRGGTMYIFGCHLIDLIHLILGAPNKVTPYLRNTLPGNPSPKTTAWRSSSIPTPPAPCAPAPWRSTATAGGSWWSAAPRERLRSSLWNGRPHTTLARIETYKTTTRTPRKC